MSGTNITAFQWVGPIQDMEGEFARIDRDGGGQILFSEFVDWALEKDLDIEDDIDEDWFIFQISHIKCLKMCV